MAIKRDYNRHGIEPRQSAYATFWSLDLSMTAKRTLDDTAASLRITIMP